MQHERTARAWLLALGIAGAIFSAALPGRVRACTCPDQWGSPQWPLADATDVPVDTPLVFARYNLTGSTEAIGYALVDADGHEVALYESSRLEPAYVGCDAYETLFLRPIAALEPDAQYVFKATGDPTIESEHSARFTTSSERWSPEPAAKVALEYLLVTQPTCPEDSCLALAEAAVTFDTAPAAPRWLVLASASLEHSRNAYRFDPTDAKFELTHQLSVALPSSGDRCIDAAIYGVGGNVLWQQRSCEPNRCARSDSTTVNFCGGPPFSGIRASDIASGSCGAPPTIEPQVPQGQTPAPEGGGCGIRPRRPQPRVWGLSAWLLAALIWQRQRRK